MEIQHYLAIGFLVLILVGGIIFTSSITYVDLSNINNTTINVRCVEGCSSNMSVEVYKVEGYVLRHEIL